jgi:hypothetical protein
MIDTRIVLETIEEADHREPFCSCGEPTQVVARGGGLWLACSTIAAERSRRGIFSRLSIAGHTNRLLIELAA